MIKAIDIHCHFNNGSPYDTKTSEVYFADLPFLQKERKRLNIALTAHSTFASVLSDKNIYDENEFLFDCAESEESVFQWLVLDPRKKELFPQIERLIVGKKVLGIKIHSVMHEYDIEKYGDEIFAFADSLKATVLMHNDKIPLMPAFCDKYKNMRLIIAHLGGEEHVAAVMAAKNGNLFVDTSGQKSYYNNVIEYAVKTVGSEKILFGTDAYSCAFQRGRIDYADISEDDKKNILYRNALRLFPKLAEAFGRVDNKV